MQFSHQLLWPWQIPATEHSPELSLSCWPASTSWEHNWSVQADKKRIFHCAPNSLLSQKWMRNSLCHTQAIELCSSNTPPNFMHSHKSSLRNISRNAYGFKECRGLGKVYSSQERKNKPYSTQWYSGILSSLSVSWECESECQSQHEEYKAVIPIPWGTHSSISAVLVSKNTSITQCLRVDKFSGHLWHLKKFRFETEVVVNWVLIYKEKGNTSKYDNTSTNTFTCLLV